MPICGNKICMGQVSSYGSGMYLDLQWPYNNSLSEVYAIFKCVVYPICVTILHCFKTAHGLLVIYLILVVAS